MDPTGSDATARLMAYGHPAAMLLALLAAGVALRAGLEMRKRRAARKPPQAALRRRHMRFAKPAVVVLLAGSVSGPLSAVYLRGWEVLGTFHGWVALLAALLFGGCAWLGHRLEHGDLERRQAHALAGVLAFLVASLASLAGFVLLP